MADTAIDKFIAKSQEMTAPSSDDVTISPDEWDTVAPGVDTSDFQPRDIPLPPPPPAIVGPGVDSGRTPNPFLVSTKKDIEDFFAEPGICGLINLGNTCYMNAGLQCLRSIPHIAQFYWKSNHFLSTKRKEDDVKEEREGDGEEGAGDKGEGDGGGGAGDTREGEEEGRESTDKDKEEGDEKKQVKEKPKDNKNLTRGHISARLSALIRKIWAGQFSAVIPQTFKTTLGLLYPQFGGYRQQDCQEFLVILLDCLHEDMCHYNVIENDEKKNEKKEEESLSLITETFQGQLKNEVTCSVCGHTSIKYDPFVYLSVPIPHSNERQFTVYWSTIGTSSTRNVTKLLLVVPILCTINELKVSLCQLIDKEEGGGNIKPDNIVIAHVKNHAIISTLANTLAIKLLNTTEYQIYAFHIESTPRIETTPTKDAPTTDRPISGDTVVQSFNGYELLPDSSEPVPMETDSGSNNDPWQPVPTSDSSDLPAKIPRSEDDEEEATPLLEGEEPKVVVMEWHMCVICLEEMIDSDLLTHTSCGATICSTCLEASRTHSGNEETGHMPCPVCQSVISSVDGFVPLATPDKSEDVVRLLQLTVIFRNESDGVWTLFGHPCLRNIPARGSVTVYYQSIVSLLPQQCGGYTWSLALTDGKGQYCSRCSFGSGCHGCVLSNAMDEVSLKPGDFLSVSFCDLPANVIEEANSSLLHSSLDTLWPSTVSLQDCLDLFSQKEILGTDNPWWCSKCEVSQVAIRQLIISSLPTTLIVHLKRFLFHGNNASKVDTGVKFPLSFPVSSSQSNDVSNMSLASCVCHFGSLNSGHYTAYSRQPVTNKWHYYNDESVTEIQPSEKDSESVYIFFYHRESGGDSVNCSDIELPTERGCTYPSEEEELLQLEPLLRVLKPKPKPSSNTTTNTPFIGPLIKRSSSTGNLTDTGGDINDIQLQQQLAASLGLELPVTPTTTTSTDPSSFTVKSSSSNPSLATESSSVDDAIVLKSVRFKAFDV